MSCETFQSSFSTPKRNKPNCDSLGFKFVSWKGSLVRYRGRKAPIYALLNDTNIRAGSHHDIRLPIRRCRAAATFASSHRPSMPITLENLSVQGVIEISQQDLILAFSTAIGFAIFLAARYLQSPWRNLPPGPRGLPLLGNALQLRSQQWLTFMKWKQEFGRSRCRCVNTSNHLCRGRFLLKCSRTAYSRPQHPEDRGRFAGPPCRNLL